ncbi:MAG: type IV secretory system conjugative DNA transfer family protein [Acidipropionibacterium jensenii]|nr:type IV secretory system conjugative DNA transfer family protein [Acidipropionibacterium jensenii]
MSQSQRTGSMGDELTNAAIIGLLALAGFALVLRGAGSAAAWLSGTSRPTVGPASGIRVLLHPSDPGTALGTAGLNPVIYWAVASLMLALIGTAGVMIWLRVRRFTSAVEADPRRMAGTATRSDITQTASTKALLKRAASLRPSLDSPKPEDVGYLLGRSKGAGVWASVEDSIMVIGPPRSGKGLHLVIPAILDAPGAVVCTSTRPDNLTATMRARARIGRVAIFDPQHLAEGLPAGMCWSPIRGCENPQTAMIRATGLAAGTGLSSGGVDSGVFWEGKTRSALQALLHAAAIDHRSPAELFRWTLDPVAAADAGAILNAAPTAATGWAESLQAMIDSDPRTRDSIWQGVSPRPRLAGRPASPRRRIT